MIGKAKSKYIISVCTRKLGSKLHQTLKCERHFNMEKGALSDLGKKVTMVSLPLAKM